MDTNFKTVTNTDDLNEIYNIIFSEKNSFVPVLKGKKIVGVIDATNLNEYILLQSKLAY
jgi:predicted transcriptional regulator